VEVEEGIKNRCKKFGGLHIIQEELKYINRKKRKKKRKSLHFTPWPNACSKKGEKKLRKQKEKPNKTSMHHY